MAIGHLLPCLWVARRCWWWRPRRSGRARHGDSPRSLGSRWGHPARWKEPPPQGDLWPPRKGHSRGTRGQHHRGGDPWRSRSHGGDYRGTSCDSGNRTTGSSHALFPSLSHGKGCRRLHWGLHGYRRCRRSFDQQGRVGLSQWEGSETRRGRNRLPGLWRISQAVVQPTLQPL